MKRNGRLFGLAGVWVAVAVLLGACFDSNEKPSPEPSASPSAEPVPTAVSDKTPEGVVQAYVAAWRRLDYSAMYALLTPAAREAATEAQFAELHAKSYETLEAANLSVEALPMAQPTPGDGASSGGVGTVVVGFDYRATMDTVAGPLAFEQHGRVRKADEGGEAKWRIDWKPSFVFPGMEEGDQVRVQKTAGERGEIVDRDGHGLAVNGSAPQLGIVPGKLGEGAADVKAKIADKLGLTVKDIDKKLGASWVKPELFVPIAVVSESAADALGGLPGVSIQQKALRVYPLGEAAAHLTGYVGEINADELAKRKDDGYAVGDLIGKSGLEQVLEEQLRGKDGIMAVLADSRGARKSVLAETPAVPGKTFRLTIDAALQRSVYDEVKADAASAAAIDPRTGEVLALLSSPAYDPNAFARGVTNAQYAAWNDDPRKPFLNRFSKAYVPGSSFKLVTAAIGLDEKALDPAEKRAIGGLKWTKDKSWGNYYVTRVHEVGSVDLRKALVYSDNIYFAQTALAIGKAKLTEGAAKFGFGEALPLEYPIGKSQLANGSIKGDIQLADSGYGQGQVTMSTLHGALLYASLANEGNIPYPRLLRDGEETAPKTWKTGAMSPESAALLKDDLVQAVAAADGVGHGASVAGAKIAGKTGTAELKASKNEEGQENGWFIGFDANDPKLLVSLMVEDVGKRGGSGYVAPMFKRIYERYLSPPKEEE